MSAQALANLGPGLLHASSQPHFFCDQDDGLDEHPEMSPLTVAKIAKGDKEQPYRGAPKIIVSEYGGRPGRHVIPLDAHGAVALSSGQAAPLMKRRSQLHRADRIVTVLAGRIESHCAARELANLLSCGSSDRDHLPGLHIAARGRPTRSVENLVHQID